MYPPSLQSFVDFTCGQYNEANLRKFEHKLLYTLQFDINMTPATTFLENYGYSID